MDQQQLNIEDEGNYVLGMMELYENDAEIEKMLRLKQMPEDQVQRILALVKREGYLKRIRQAKRLMLIGGSVLLIFVVIGLYIYFNANKFWSSSYENDRMGRRVTGRVLYIGFFYGIGQSVYGTIRYFSYKRKLNRLDV